MVYGDFALHNDNSTLQPLLAIQCRPQTAFDQQRSRQYFRPPEQYSVLRPRYGVYPYGNVLQELRGVLFFLSGLPGLPLDDPGYEVPYGLALAGQQRPAQYGYN